MPNTDYQNIIQQLYEQIQSEENFGEVATYIPELSKVNPDYFGIHLTTIDKREFGAGDHLTKFSIQSISKVLSLSIAYELLGDAIWERVDVEPSGTAFNSLLQLESDYGIPRNPFINAGAMVICDMLLSHFKHPDQELLQYIHDITGNSDIQYNPLLAASEKKIGYRNFALCYYLKSFDNIENRPEDVLDFYFKMCSLEMTCQELSHVFLFLADENFLNQHHKPVITLSKAKRINAIMQTCGFYDESGEFSFRVGLPGKSGVGGGIIALHPDKYCIAVWSPKLNAKGNSYKGMKFLEMFTTSVESSIF